MNRCFRLPLLTLTALATTSVVGYADEKAVDWLYLTGKGTWAEQSISVSQYPHEEPVPTEASRLWWEQHQDDRMVTRVRREHKETLSPGTRVRINQSYAQHRVSAGTELTVLQVLESGILLTDGSTSFLIAPENYSILSIPVPSEVSDLLRLESDAEPDSRKIAWFTEALQGEVAYDLDLSDPDAGTLQQQIRLNNQSDLTISAEGFSYQPDGPQATPFARTLETASTVSADQASEVITDYQALIEYPHAITVAAQSETWLPVASMPVATDNDFYFQWRFNTTRNQAAQWRLSLTAEEALPRLAGPAAVSWFDQQRATIDSQFRRTTEQAAILNLGQNDQVTLTAEQESDDSVWNLTFHNHLDQDVAVELDMTYQVSGMNQPVSRVISMDLPPGSHTRQVRGQPSGIEEI